MGYCSKFLKVAAVIGTLTYVGINIIDASARGGSSFGLNAMNYLFDALGNYAFNTTTTSSINADVGIANITLPTTNVGKEIFKGTFRVLQPYIAAGVLSLAGVGLFKCCCSDACKSKKGNYEALIDMSLSNRGGYQSSV